MIDNSTPIGGNGIEVEIDESKFGKWKYHKGNKVEGQWVFGGREKYNKKQIFMIPVCKRKEATLIPIINKEAIWLYAELFLGHHGGLCHGLC